MIRSVLLLAVVACGTPDRACLRSHIERSESVVLMPIGTDGGLMPMFEQHEETVCDAWTSARDRECWRCHR